MRISRTYAWIIVLAGTCLTGIADHVTPQETWFGPIYLLIIGSATWALGWREAIAVGLVCLGLGLSANGLSLYPFGTVAAVWNLAMRILAILMMIAALHNARRSYTREWLRARTDPLTGAFNRQAFFELAGPEHHSRAWNLLAYADLDGLKKLNDERGHEVGDQCLKDYAAHVIQAIRKDDIFARIGGDEFLAYMAVRDEAAAKAVAARLHREMNVVTSAIDDNLRCSIGVLIMPPGPRTLSQEVRIADELMYEAKSLGAALTVATAHERSGTLFVARHWELTQSFGSDQHDQPVQGRLDLGDLEAVIRELPSQPDVEERQGVRLRPSTRAAA